MSALAHLTIQASQFPENVRRDLLESLRTRQINHKFLYDSYRQTQKWLALHQAFSPARNDPDCAAVYDCAFHAAATRSQAPSLHLLGLGCGGGQKDARLLQLLAGSVGRLSYTPVDVSVAMVLVARRAALMVVPEHNSGGFVCDLASPEFDAGILASRLAEESASLVTFFGMLPNFEPQVILPRLAAMLCPGDLLLLSANLAPGDDYAAGMQRVLPQYDNALTRDWLLTFLLDIGVDPNDGELGFTVEEVPAAPPRDPSESRTNAANDISPNPPGTRPASGGLRRVAVHFHFLRPRRIQIEEHPFDFSAGDSLRLFFSYRHTPALLVSLLAQHGLQVLDQWITKSQEEGVFLCQSIAPGPKGH